MNDRSNDSTEPPPRRREIAAWALFDFANSSFTTVVTTVVFGVYFSKVICDDRSVAEGAALWSRCAAISNLFILLTAPLVGAIADRARGKKRFLFASYVLCVGATAALFFCRSGDIALAMSLYVAANIAFSTGENLVAGFLPDLAKAEDMGRISSLGWASGYAGGLASLAFCLPLALAKNADGSSNDMAIRATNLVVAAFFLAGGLPTFLFVRERGKRGVEAPLGAAFFQGFRQLSRTWRERRKHRQMGRFLLAYVVFNIGIYGVINFAGIYAEQLYRFEMDAVIKIFMVTQLTAGAGALLAGRVSAKYGCARTLGWTLWLWVACCIPVLVSRHPAAYWITALFAGLAMGSSLPSARALVGRFTPAGRGGEFFGLWGQFARLAVIVGSLGHELVLRASGNRLEAGILFFGATFIVGRLLLTRVDESAGVDEARRA